MRPIAIIFIGPPGSGKSTQAGELVKRFGILEHFDLGHVIEKTLYDPQNQDSPKIQEEKHRFETGELVSSEWVVSLEKEHITCVAAAGKGVIFSGSPREREEAEFLIPFLEETYGGGAIFVFSFVVGGAVFLFRNTRRRVCEDCGTVVIWSKDTEDDAFCPACGGKLVRRSLDTVEATQRRLREYEHKAEAILAFFVAVGLPIFQINGERTPEEIAGEIASIVKQHI